MEIKLEPSNSNALGVNPADLMKAELQSGTELRKLAQTENEPRPARGGLTYDAEGSSDPQSPYYSRKAHVPSESSGVTIGRGYDMSQRSQAQIVRELTSCGLSETSAKAFIGAAGLTGKEAREFIAARTLPTITAEQELKIFDLTYKQSEADVRRICAKKDVVDAYGATDWEKLNSSIKEVLIDLRFRGDYSPAARKIIQKSISENDLTAFKEQIKNKDNWKNVPQDRFERRSSFISSAN